MPTLCLQATGTLCFTHMFKYFCVCPIGLIVGLKHYQDELNLVSPFQVRPMLTSCLPGQLLNFGALVSFSFLKYFWACLIWIYFINGLKHYQGELYCVSPFQVCQNNFLLPVCRSGVICVAWTDFIYVNLAITKQAGEGTKIYMQCML